MSNIFGEFLSSSHNCATSEKLGIERKTLLRLIQTISSLYRTDTSSVRSAISALLPLIHEPENAILVCQDPEMGILQTIKESYEITLRNGLIEVSPDAYIVRDLTVVLSWLAIPQRNAIRICSKNFGFLPILLQIVATTNSPSHSFFLDVWEFIRNEIRVILGNCSVHVETHDYLFLSEFAYFDLCKKHLFETPDSPGEVSRFCSLTMNIADSAHMLLLVDMGIPEFFLKKLIFYGSQRIAWVTEHWNMIDRCFCILLNFSLHPPCCPALRVLVESPDIGGLSFFDFFVQNNPNSSLKGVKTVMFLSNLYRDSKYNFSINPTYLLRNSPYVVPMLLDIYEATLNYNEKRDLIQRLKKKAFMFGRLSMKQITGSLKNFAIISDDNIQMLFCHDRFLYLVFATIQLFIVDAPECEGTIISTTGVTRGSTAGGGGKDYESLENVLELLLQLAYFYSRHYPDIELRFVLSVPSSTWDTKLFLNQLLLLPEKRKLPNKACQCVVLLLNLFRRPSFNWLVTFWILFYTVIDLFPTLCLLVFCFLLFLF
jgi:hypothetical protein